MPAAPTDEPEIVGAVLKAPLLVVAGDDVAVDGVPEDASPLHAAMRNTEDAQTSALTWRLMPFPHQSYDSPAPRNSQATQRLP
jgi:hypothetical protein